MSEQHEGAPTGGFQFNGPVVVSVLYLATYFTVFSALIGLIFAYVWRRQPVPDWQRSQFTYLIRTFWMGIGGYLVLAFPLLVAIGTMSGDLSASPLAMTAAFVLGAGGMLALTVLLIFRCAFVIVNAQQRVPMANTNSWTV